MTVVEASVEIDAPIPDVWEVVSDPRNLPRWDRRVVAVKDPPPRGLEIGSRYTAVVGFMGVRARVACEVMDVRAAEYAKIHLRGLVEATVETWLRTLDENRTLLRHRVDYRFAGGSLGALIANAVNILGAGTLLRRGTESQKRQVEEDRSRA